MTNQISQKCISVLLLLCMLFSFSACNSAPLKYDGPTRTIVDCANRTVEVPETPKRVVAMYASTAHMMAMLDVGDLIVGCADGIRRDALMLEKYPAIENTSTPYKEGAINIEEIMELNPDLVIIRSTMYATEPEREKLDKIGVPYIVVDYFSIEELRNAITVMGDAFDKADKAQKYVKYLDDTLSYVDGRVADIAEADKVHVYHAVTQSTATDTADCLAAEIVTRAGLISTSRENGLDSFGKTTVVTLEEIYKWDADAIISNEYAVTDYITSQKRWANLSAVKNNRVYTLPIGATRWCHGGSMEPQMAALFLAQLFYPEKFEDLDLKKTVYDYYLEFFDMDFPEETIDKILSGRGMREASGNLELE